MNDNRLKCAFTGHREDKLAANWSEYSKACSELKQNLADAVEHIYNSGIYYFICGMAHGCDMYFAEAVLALKNNHPDIILEAAIPYAGQAGRWRGNLKLRYDEILSKCDVKTVLQQTYTRDCMMRRNMYMVDNSAVLVAVYSGAAGGTRNTLLYAMRKGLQIVEIEVV